MDAIKVPAPLTDRSAASRRHASEGGQPVSGGPSSGPEIDPKDHRIEDHNPFGQRIWDYVSHSTVHSLWNFEGVSPKLVMKRTAKSFMDDNLISRAAELGYYFLFALFPTLISASAILGLAAKSASKIYVSLLNYLAVLVPHSAYQLVIENFNQMTQASNGGKITLGLVAALWSASVGFSAIQDTLNNVYKVKETRPYWKARGSAILVTILLSAIVTLNLSALLVGDLTAHWLSRHIAQPHMAALASALVRVASWVLASGLLMLLFSTIYYYAPDVKAKCWHWLTPGAAIGIAAWLIASIGLRIYLHYFPSYSVTYGSLGAVIILLTWFYITGLTLLAGAEINSEIQAAVVERRLKQSGQLPEQASTDPLHPVTG